VKTNELWILLIAPAPEVKPESIVNNKLAMGAGIMDIVPSNF
jgi:hypothetical protein